ncbi:MAG: glycosyltransferase family 9 protein [Candidatus Eremiobacteraeota bacterium]|nr:glycosyltransferase family 9 protein [Candidatus Eremiobacteraeota bacterium]
MKRVLAIRQDNNGDVLLIGPALRAIGSQARVDLMCGPRGAAAGRLLPGVDAVDVWEAAWIDAEPHPVSRADIDALVDRLRVRYDEAVIFTSFHQSPLPMALVLRMAGIQRIGAISVDYPGSLLDVRHRVDDEIHEVERALSLAAAMGYTLPRGDDGRLRFRELPPPPLMPAPYVVVHPGCTMTARTWSADGFLEVTRALCTRGYYVAVTGSANESDLTAYVASGHERARNFGGATSFAKFASLVAGAVAAVCGNTATTHVAAAVGTPVAEIFPPTISFARFRPWMVSYEVFGDGSVACAGCRARACPFDDHPCLQNVRANDIADAVARLHGVGFPNVRSMLA